MLPITKQLKKDIQKLESIEERLSLMKNKYEGETAFVTGCGPTLNKLDDKVFRSKLDNKLVLSMKQSFDFVGADFCDFHLMNTYNIKPGQYVYKDNIIIWGVSKSYADQQLQKIVNQQRPLDLYWPIINPPFITKEQTINGSKNFDDMKLLESRCEVTWGPGLFYELVMPLLYHLGVRNLVTFGFDLNVNQYQHFYGEVKSSNCFPPNGESKQIIDASTEFYNWCQENNFTMKIVSDLNQFDNRFERIKLKDLN